MDPTAKKRQRVAAGGGSGSAGPQVDATQFGLEPAGTETHVSADCSAPDA